MEWLGKRMIAPYAHVFARNQLDSLRKIAQLRAEHVVKLHDEFCAPVGGDSTTKVGGYILLEEAVASLAGDCRTKTITNRLREYKDTNVSGDMLIAAQNQLEVRVSKSKAVIAHSLFWTVVIVLFSIFLFPFAGLQLHNAVQSGTQPYSMTSYGVQLSANNINWTDVADSEGSGGGYVFDSSSSATQPGLVVTNLFPHPAEARYVRVLPRSWQGQRGYNGDGDTGANLRLGIVGNFVDGPSLDFSVMLDGLPGQAWLQNGCSSRHGATPGQWVSKAKNAGHVQCCLPAPRTHVCTRDGCLSGSGGDAVKVNWHEAISRCATRGWRLCRREELNRKASSGCCGSPESATNMCGYDEEPVWTSTVVDVDQEDDTGRLHSDTAFENVKQITVDLLRVRWIDGLTIQGGVPEIWGHGQGCVLWTWYWALAFFGPLVSFVYQLATNEGPLTAVKASYFQWIYTWCGLATYFFVVATDVNTNPAAPGILSNNPCCKTRGPSISSTSYSILIGIGMYSWMIIVYFFRPHRFYELVNPVHYVGCSAIFWFLLQNTPYRFLTFIPIIYIVLSYPRDIWRRRRCHQQARLALKDDVKKYNAAWSSANAPGLKWKEVGSQKPRTGTEIINEALATALKQTLSFHPGELGEFKIGEVSDDSYIKVGDTYFQPAVNRVMRKRTATLAAPHGRQVHPDTQPSDPDRDDVSLIHLLCAEDKVKIRQERDDVIARWSFLDRFLFSTGAGPRSWQQESRYGRTGKYRQRTKNIDLLFEEAATLNDSFLQLIGNEMLGASQSFEWRLVRGPVKRPDRSLQKVVRKYYRDARCLTDIIRCCITLPSIESVRQCLEVIRCKCVVGALPAHGDRGTQMLSVTMEEAKSESFFKLVKIKDRFSVDQEDGYRYICLNVEVAWTITSESENSLKFVSMYGGWDKPNIRTHICEIQLVLDSMYDLKIKGCHENFVTSRNLLAK